MKDLIFAGFLILALLAAQGCHENNGSSDADGVALSENDFASDASITVDPEKDHFVTFLEHPSADLPDRDTGGLGTDIVAFEFNRTVTFSPCWLDEDGEAGHSMALLDSEGAEVLRVEANGECPSETIAPGVYQAVFTHDGLANGPVPVFGRVDPDSMAFEVGILDGIRGYIIGILGSLDLASDSYAQQAVINHILESKKCENCFMNMADFTGAPFAEVDLSGSNLNDSIMTEADLRGADLSETMMKNVDLRGADLRCFDDLDGSTTCTDLTKAILISADFSTIVTASDTISTLATGAILSRASMDNANLSGATFTFAKLNGAIMKNTTCNGTLFRGTDLIGVNFEGSDLTNANFVGVLFFSMSDCPTVTAATDICRTDLTNAGLTGVTLSNTNFGTAIWCFGDNCICNADNSINNCDGCSTISACTIER